VFVRSLALLAAAPLLALALPAPAFASAVPVPAARLMSLVVTMTNQQRHAYGCGRLDVDHELIDASERQSGYMAVQHRMSHIGWGGSTFVTRARLAGYAEPAGENIAWGYRTARQVMDAWMASPAHRRNILNCDLKSIGTGVRYSDDGTPYYTQVFGWE
jgi:uncharacterized protein YkwD